LTHRARIWLLLWLPLPATAQSHPLALNETQYEVAAGAPVALDAPSDTLSFLLSAKSFGVSIPGLVAGPNRAGAAGYASTVPRSAKTRQAGSMTLTVVPRPLSLSIWSEPP